MNLKEETFTRTDYCGNFRLKDVGRKVSILGWVSKIRKLGSLMFLDIRDREGYLQVCIKPDEISVPEIGRAHV